MTQTTATKEIRLREWTSCGGCGAKWPAAELRELLSTQSVGEPTADLLVGLNPFDDAAVLQISPDLALVSTTDFFPPLVDDPADFGAIAAANACSDIFAMGADVVLAVNVAAFPEEMPVEVVMAILGSAAETVQAAGGVIAGGHTIRNPEPVFGLAVQGLVRDKQYFMKLGAKPGDRIVLSKPLGTGLVLAANNPGEVAVVTSGMRKLNRQASEVLRTRFAMVHAVTDVTGFGLLGHAFEMAERSQVVFEVEASALPLYPGALDAARAGLRTGADSRNRAYAGTAVEVHSQAEFGAIGFDPQTSGGLLAAVDPSVVAELLDYGFVEIGAVTAARDNDVLVRLV